MGFSLKIDTLLGCLWSRNISFLFGHKTLLNNVSADLTKVILNLEIAKYGFMYHFKRNNYTGDITYCLNEKLINWYKHVRYQSFKNDILRKFYIGI